MTLAAASAGYIAVAATVPDPGLPLTLAGLVFGGLIGLAVYEAVVSNIGSYRLHKTLGETHRAIDDLVGSGRRIADAFGPERSPSDENTGNPPRSNRSGLSDTLPLLLSLKNGEISVRHFDRQMNLMPGE